jgi:prepilin-type N-terminal cleavage/methylation domain-containing protein
LRVVGSLGIPSIARIEDGMKARGFSLVELLVVIAMIGILAAIAYPAIDSLRNSANSAMLQVGTALQAAQREAVARQHDVLVIFDAATSRIQLVFDANNNGVPDGGERTRGIALEPQIVFGRGGAPARSFGAGPVTLSDGSSTLIFHRNGSASASGGLYLTSVKAAAGDARRMRDTRAIEINRATGRIEWFRYSGSGSTWVRGF